MKKCNHKYTHISENIISGGYNTPQGMIEEYDIVCSNCKEILGHWAYGSSDLDYMLKYEYKGIKNWYKKIGLLWNISKTRKIISKISNKIFKR